MKATTLIERQHRNLQQLCEAVERGSASIRESLLPQLAGDLVAHMAVEDAVFYPAVAEALGEDTMIRAGRARHSQARRQLDRILDLPVDAEEFPRELAELRATIELHAEEEEELLYPRLEAVLDVVKMRRLALSMLSVYHARVEAGYARAMRSPVTTTSYGGSGIEGRSVSR